MLLEAILVALRILHAPILIRQPQLHEFSLSGVLLRLPRLGKTNKGAGIGERMVTETCCMNVFMHLTDNIRFVICFCGFCDFNSHVAMFLGSGGAEETH